GALGGLGGGTGGGRCGGPDRIHEIQHVACLHVDAGKPRGARRPAGQTVPQILRAQARARHYENS
ncbi:hypothetical protein, partial [Cupriavidus campinensis]|uniref:hypothetical protein n=1 Tax=Cupriavidus campinensis TaxID=151783 RepID=UPI001BACEE5C